MKIKVVTLASITTLLGAATGLCTDAPLQFALTPDVELFPRTVTVSGLSLNLWGENPQNALALGLINGSTGESTGLSLGVVNYDDSYTGMQFGAVNLSHENFEGWQSGCVNVCQGTFVGWQLGAVNVAEDASGFQLGAVNYAQTLHGLQIGVLNIVAANPGFTAMPDKLAAAFPILNWSF
jgi:hypothetical protein